MADEYDVQLLRRMADGDEAALDDLYARHAPALFSYLLTLTDDRFEAEEVLQDTLVVAWRSARRFEGRARVRTWLLAIAHRQERDRRRRHAITIGPEAELDRLTDVARGPEELALAHEEVVELGALVARLNPSQRTILALAFVHQLSYAEIAAVLDLPIGTVKSRLNNARNALQSLRDQQQEVPE